MLRKIDQILPSLAPKVLRNVSLLQEMTASARSRLPQNIAVHSWVGSFNEHSITIITDSPAHVIYLRAHQKEILKQLQEDFFYRLEQPWSKVRISVARHKS